jgi:haloacid dehalogenase-like hydrolase/E1-E2 ATPase
VSSSGTSSRPRGAPDTVSRVVSRARRWFEPALLATTVALLVAGGVAWVLGSAGGPTPCGRRRRSWRWIRRWLGGGGAAAADRGCRRDRGPGAGGHACGGRVPGGRANRRDAGDRAGAGRGRATPRHTDLRALLERAPRTARRRVGDVVGEVGVDEVAVGELMVVGPGEVLPVDGLVEAGPAALDESALTGEPELVEHAVGEPVRSGTLKTRAAPSRCAAPSPPRRAPTPALSPWSGRQARKRPGDQVGRSVRRLVPAAVAGPGRTGVVGERFGRSGGRGAVVATPCPLLLAVPGGDRGRAVARFATGGRGAQRWRRWGSPWRGRWAASSCASRSARLLENLGRARTMVLDKTGTLTVGRPAVTEVAAAPGGPVAEVLRLAASADQLSPHVLAESVFAEARGRGLALSLPEGVEEEPGRGVTARIAGVRVRMRKHDAVPDAACARGGQPGRAGRLRAHVGRGRWRPPSAPSCSRTRYEPTLAAILRRLRAAGIGRVLMCTGEDRPERPGGREGPGARRKCAPSRHPQARSQACAPKGGARSR